MQCPRCNVTLMMTDRQGVEVDYCPQCRGVWLDRGEVDKLVEREAAFSEPSQYAPYSPNPQRERFQDRRNYDPFDDDRDDDDRFGQRRNRGWLGNLFDFD